MMIFIEFISFDTVDERILLAYELFENMEVQYLYPIDVRIL